MSDDPESYGFCEALPIRSVPPGTSLLVAGPKMDGGRDLALRLVAPRTETEGAVLITIDSGSDQLLDAYDRRYGNWPRTNTGIVEGVTDSSNRADDVMRQSVSSPGDLTGIGIRFSQLLGKLLQQDVSRVRMGLFSLSTLLMYADVKTIFRFGHTIAGRVQATDSLGVFYIDPSTCETRTVSTLTQFLGGRVDLRVETSQLEVRCRGAVEGPTDWTPVE